MKYKGIEVKEFTSDKPVIFDPPRQMFVWDDNGIGTRRSGTLNKALVYAYIPKRPFNVIAYANAWCHCAKIPDENQKFRRATNRELAKWLAQGNGECSRINSVSALASNEYVRDDEQDECDELLVIRKWDDAEWHEPTADYMGLEAK